MLRRANAELIAQHSSLVTAIVGYASAQPCEFVYSIAGHPPPLLLEPGRPPRLLEFGALPLGAVHDSVYRTYRVPTVPGALLVLYTDGAIEQTHDVLAGEARLSGVVAALDANTADPARAIHEAIFGDSQALDDVAILTIGFKEAHSDGVSLATTDGPPQGVTSGALAAQRGTSSLSSPNNGLRLIPLSERLAS